MPRPSPLQEEDDPPPGDDAPAPLPLVRELLAPKSARKTLRLLLLFTLLCLAGGFLFWSGIAPQRVPPQWRAASLKMRAVELEANQAMIASFHINELGQSLRIGPLGEMSFPLTPNQKMRYVAMHLTGITRKGLRLRYIITINSPSEGSAIDKNWSHEFFLPYGEETTIAPAPLLSVEASYRPFQKPVQ